MMVKEPGAGAPGSFASREHLIDGGGGMEAAPFPAEDCARSCY